jgi:hypothetical protein
VVVYEKTFVLAVTGLSARKRRREVVGLEMSGKRSIDMHGRVLYSAALHRMPTTQALQIGAAVPDNVYGKVHNQG